jgi:hypothetical protein
MNMKKQLGRIRLPEDDAEDEAEGRPTEQPAQQPTQQPTARLDEPREAPAPQDGDASRLQPPPAG